MVAGGGGRCVDAPHTLRQKPAGACSTHVSGRFSSPAAYVAAATRVASGRTPWRIAQSTRLSPVSQARRGAQAARQPCDGVSYGGWAGGSSSYCSCWHPASAGRCQRPRAPRGRWHRRKASRVRPGHQPVFTAPVPRPGRLVRACKGHRAASPPFPALLHQGWDVSLTPHDCLRRLAAHWRRQCRTRRCRRGSTSAYHSSPNAAAAATHALSLPGSRASTTAGG